MRVASIVALQRIVEGVSDSDGGLRCHVHVLPVIEKHALDKVPTVRAAVGNLIQAVATASQGFSSVKMSVLVSVCSKVEAFGLGLLTACVTLLLGVSAPCAHCKTTKGMGVFTLQSAHHMHRRS